MGLSPRTRGNHISTVDSRMYQGSIPAHAGEPGLLDGQVQEYGVYPRARGGTDVSRGRDRDTRGLSPRTRGNLSRKVVPLLRRGSIPAHAGEPWSDGDVDKESGVYPRARGGTAR